MKARFFFALSCFVFIATVAPAQTPTNLFWWINAGGGDWYVDSSWSNEQYSSGAPYARGSSNTVLNFDSMLGATFTTNSGNGVSLFFLLNQLNFTNSSGDLTIVGLRGTNLTFITSTGGAGPQINQFGAQVITNNINWFFSNTVTFAGTGSGAIQVNSNITGAGGLIMNGPDYVLILNGSNTYSGGTFISNGVLRATNIRALTNAVTVAPGGTFDVRVDFGSRVTNVVASGSGAAGQLGAVVNTAGTGSGVLSNLTLIGDTTIGAASGGTLAFRGLVDGGGYSLTITNGLTGIADILRPNTLTNLFGINVNQGVFRIAAAQTGSWQSAININVNNAAIDTVGGISNAMSVVLNSGVISNVSGSPQWLGRITLNGTNTILATTGSMTFRGPLTGSGSLIITANTASSTVYLLSTNNAKSWTGPLTINNARVSVPYTNSTINGLTVSNITLNSNALLIFDIGVNNTTISRGLGVGSNQVQVLGVNSGFGVSGAGTMSFYLGTAAGQLVTWGSPYFDPTNLIFFASGRQFNFNSVLDLNGGDRAVNTISGNTGSLTVFTYGITNTAGSGTANFWKGGPGVLRLDGITVINGSIVVTGGVLRLNVLVGNNNAAALGTVPLVLGNGVVEFQLPGAAFSRELGTGDNQVSLPGGASGFSSLTGPHYINLGGDGRILTWGDVNFSPTALVLNEASANAPLYFYNGLDLTGTNRTINVNYASADSPVIIFGLITNTVVGSPAGLIKGGGGTLMVVGDNYRYDGTNVIAGGVLVLGDAQTSNGYLPGSVISNTATLVLQPITSQSLSNYMVGTGSIIKQGQANVTLAGTNLLRGTTTINVGTLTLDYLAASVNGDYTTNLATGGALTLGGNGALHMKGDDDPFLVNTQIFASRMNLNAGATRIIADSSAGSAIYLWLGTNVSTLVGNTSTNIVRVAGASVEFTPPASGAIYLYTNNTLNIQGGALSYGTVTGADWVGFTGVNGNIITNYSGYTPVAAGGTIVDGSNTNVRIAGNVAGLTGPTLTSINTLSGTNDGGAYIVNLGGQSLMLGAVGGLLNPVGAGELTIGSSVGDGYLFAGFTNNVAGELVLLNYGGTLTINSAIITNGIGLTTVTVGGPGTVVFAGPNFYTNSTTYINNGTAIFSNANINVGRVDVNNATLTIADSATVSDLRLGNVQGGRGTVNISTNLTVSAGGTAGYILLGNGVGFNHAGAIYQTGGTVIATNLSRVSIGDSAYGYGYYRLSGGTFVRELAAAGSGGTLTVVGYNGYGVLDIGGGSMFISNGSLRVAQGLNGMGVINITNGLLQTVGTFILNTTADALTYGVVNVSGSGAIVATNSTIDLMTGARNVAGILNLNGGSVTARQITASSASGFSAINFNGGVLAASEVTVGNPFISGNISEVNIFTGGATIDTYTQVVTIGRSLLAPTGFGVTNVAITSQGGGYIGSPIVMLTGGSGTGATAYAAVDLNNGGIVTNIIITSYGTGYQAGDMLTATLYGGGFTNPAVLGTVSLGANTNTGGLTKNGTLGTLILTGTNTYGGNTVVNDGTLQLGTGVANGSILSTSVNLVAGTSVLAFNRSDVYTNWATVLGSGSVVQKGSGMLVMAAANTYNGGTFINSGLLLFDTTNAVPTTSGGIHVNAGGAVVLNSANYNANLLPYISTASSGMMALGTANANESFNFASGNFTSLILGAFDTLTYGGTYTPFQMGDTDKTNFYRFGAASGVTFTYSNKIADTDNGGQVSVVEINFGGLPGTVQLTNAVGVVNSYSGYTLLNAGTLSVSSSNNIGGQSVIIFNGGAFQYTGAGDVFGNTFSNSSALVTVDVADPAATLFLTGAFTNTLNVLAKTGGGTLVFSNNAGGLTTTSMTNRQGNLVFLDTAVTNTTGAIQIGAVSGNTATLTLRGSTTVTNLGALNIGMVSGAVGVMVMTNSASYMGVDTMTIANGAGVTGKLYMTDGTLANLRAINVGSTAGSVGAIYQTGGYLVGSNNIVIGNSAGGYGFYELQGGTLSSTGGWIYVGNLGLGVMYQSGGYITNNFASRGILVGSTAGTGSVYQSGGVAFLGDIRMSGGTGGRAEYTIDGGELTATNVYMNYAVGTNIFNLNSGGTGIFSTVQKRVAGGLSIFNFDGGTLRAATNNTILLGSGAGGLLDATYIREKGAVIDVQNGTNTILQALLAPSGHGVTNINLASPVGGYVGAPYVGISGGSGTGATAVAIFDSSSGQVTGFKITSPGAGYGAGDSLTVTLVGGGQTNFTIGSGDILLGENSSGGLTKLGTSTSMLILSNNNTYLGSTVIDNGTLQLGAGGPAGSLLSTNVHLVAATSVLAYNRSDTFTNAIPVTGSGWFVQNGSGSLVIVSTNTHTGGTLVNKGQLWFDDAATVPSSHLVFVNTNSVLGGNFTNIQNTLVPRIDPGSGGMLGLAPTNANEDISFATYNHTNLVIGSAVDLTYGGSYTPYSQDGTNYWRLGAYTNATFTFTNVIADTIVSVLEINNGGLPGTVVLENTNTYSGYTILNAGTLSVANLADSGSPIPTNNSLFMFNGGSLRYTGSGDTSSLNITNIASAVFEITNPSADLILAGEMAGAGGIRKYGDGALTLGGVTMITNGLVDIYSGTVNMTGTSRWSGANNIYSWTVRSNAVLNISGDFFNAGRLSIGDTLGFTAIVNQTGGTVVNAGDYSLNIGRNGPGIYNLYGGSISNSGRIDLGMNAGVSDNLFNMTNGFLYGGTLEIGRRDLATGRNMTNYFVQSGGEAVIANLYIASSTNAVGYLTISNGTFTARAFTDLARSTNSQAYIYLGPGANVTLPSFPTNVVSDPGSYAEITFDGATLTAGYISGAYAPNYLGRINNAYITNSLNFVVGAGTNVIITQILQERGGPAVLNKYGNGMLLLSNAAPHTGSNYIHEGVLAFGDSAVGSHITVYSNATVGVAFSGVQTFLSLTGTLFNGGAVALTEQNPNENIDFTQATGLNFTNGFLGAISYVNLIYGGVHTPYDDTYRFGGGVGTLTYNAIIGGSSNLIIGGGQAITVVLGATNTYTGNTILNNGTLSVVNFSDVDGNIPTNGLFIFNGGALQYTGPDATTARIITNVGNGTFDIALTNSTLIYSNSIAGAGGLTKSGPGTLTFAYAQQFEGGFTVNTGFVQLASVENPLFTNGAITVNGGTLDFGGATQKTINVVSFYGGLTTNGAIYSYVHDFNIQGGLVALTLGGPVGLVKDGTNTLLLTTPNYYTGRTLINAGTLAISDANALGGGLSVITNRSILALDAVMQIANPMVMINGTNFTSIAAAGSAWNGTIKLDPGTTNTFNITTNGTGATTADFTVNSVISGDGALNKAGTGSLLLTNKSTYTGGTIISAGTLRLNGGRNPLSIDGAITVNGGVFDLNGGTQTMENAIIQFNGGVTSNGVIKSEWFDYDGRGGTVAAKLTGDVNLVKTNSAGTLTLLATNTYTGNTFLNAGTLSVASLADVNGTILFSSQIIFDGGALRYLGTGDITARGIINDGGGARFDVTNSTAILTINSSIAGTGSLAKSGLGTLLFTYVQEYTGGTIVNAGTLMLGAGDDTLFTNGVITLNGGVLDLNGTTQNTYNVVQFTGGTTVDGVIHSHIFDYDGRSGTVGATLTGNVNLVKTTTGTLVLSNVSRYTGLTIVSDGELRLQTAGALAVGNLVISNGVIELGGYGNFTRALGAGNNQFQITGVSGFSARDANRTVTLNTGGANVVWGSTYFNPTALILNGDGANRILTFANGLDLNGGNRTILNNAGTISVISGNITNSIGTASLVKGGTGTLRLDGINTYNGSTIIIGGALRIGNNTLYSHALPSGNLVLSNGAIEINYGVAGSAFTGTLGTGLDQVYLVPGSTSGFSAASAPRTINIGGTGSNLIWGSANFKPTALLLNANLAGAVLTLENGIDLKGTNRQVNVDANVAVITGIVTNSVATEAGLVKGGAGTLKVVGANYLYNGTTIVNAGTMQLGDYQLNNAVLPGPISNNAYVVFANPFDQTITNNLSGTGDFRKYSPADLTLIGDNSGFRGTQSVYNGTLILDYSDPLAPSSGIGGVGSVLTLQGGTLTVQGGGSGVKEQIFRSLVVNAGASHVLVTNTGAAVTLTISNVTRAAGGVVDFNVTGIGQIISNMAGAFGILGGYATLNKADWLTVDGSSNIVAFTGYTAPAGGQIQDGSNTHVRIDGNVSLAAAGTTGINTLSGTNDGGAYTVTIGGGNTLRLGALGGLLNPTGAGALTIGSAANDGILTAGFTNNAAGELILLNYSSNPLTINSSLTNNGTGNLTVTIGGTGPVLLNGNNSFRGALYINGGSAVTIGEGSTNILEAGALNLNWGSLVVSGMLSTAAEDEYVGVSYGGVGTLTLAGSGTFQHTNADTSSTFILGNQVGSVGVLNIQDNALYSNRVRTHVGNIGTGIVNQTGGTYVNVENTYIGNAGSAFSANPNSVGLYFLSGGGFTNIGTLYVGNQGIGAFYQTGGSAVVGGEQHLGENFGSYGYYEFSGGTRSNAGVVRVGLQGMGVYYLSGGTNIITSTAGMRLGEGVAGVGVVYATSGVLSNAGPIDLGYNAGVNRAEFTVAGDASVVMTNNVLRMNVGSGVSAVNPAITTNALNLNGGLLQLNSIVKTVTGGLSVVNFNGGTLQANINTTNFMGGLDGAYVYNGGAVINDGGKIITITQGLLAPTGSGITNIPHDFIVDPIEGYVGAPYVSLTGGSGTGATAVALFDRASGNVTGVVITSYGSGYQAGDTVSATLMGGGNTNYLLGTVLLGTNENTGGLSKYGAGILTLAGINTYGGTTYVHEGAIDILYQLPDPGTLIIATNAGLILGYGGLGQWSAIEVSNAVANLVSPNGFFGLDTALATNHPTYGYALGGFSNFYKLGANTLIVSGTSTYTGDAYVLGGGLRAEWGTGLPNTANLILNGGVWETSGGIASSWGTGDGQFQLPGGVGGFSAVGRPLIVDFGGAGQTLVWGGTNIFNPSVLLLNSLSANTNLIFVNPIDLNGATRTISVESTNHAAIMVGDIFNTGAAAGLTKIGSGTLIFFDNAVNVAGFTNFQGGLTFLDAAVTNTSATVVQIGPVSGNAATLTLAGNTIFTNSAQMQLGAAAGGLGVLVMSDNATYIGGTWIQVGLAGTGIVYMTGGTLQTGANGLILANGAGAGAIYQSGGVIITPAIYDTYSGGYGYYEMTGGSLTNAGVFEVPAVAGVGIFHQYGGWSTNAGAFHIGGSVRASAANATGQVYLAGGTMWVPSLTMGYSNTSRGELTIGTNANFNVLGNVLMNRALDTGGSYGLNTNIINLLAGGVMQANRIYSGTNSGLSVLNFHGGTLRAVADGVLLGGVDVTNQLSHAFIYARGATIDSSNFTVSINQSLLAPVGYGVTNIGSSITASNPLRGYIGAPYVGISGGSGTGATAVALFDSASGLVTGIVMTSYGYGYANGDTVTATLFGGGGTGGTYTATVNYQNVSGGLTKNGAGNLILSNANTYTGPTVINAGTLTLGDSNALQNSTLDYNYRGVLNFGGFNAVTLGGLQGNSNLNISGVALSVGNNNNNTAYGGVLNGNGSLIKIGAGTLILNGANTFSGNTLINTGTLTLGNALALQNSTLDYNYAGVLSFGGLSAATLGGLQGNSNLNISGVALSVGNNNSNTTYAGVLSGNGSLIKIGTGLLILSNANTHSGGTMLNAGTLEIFAGNNLGTGTLTFNGGVLLLGDSLTIAQTVTLLTNGTIDTGAGNTGTISGNIYDNGNAFIKLGSGLLVLGGSNTYGGGTVINAGTIQISVDNNLGTSGGTLTFNGGNLLFAGNVTMTRNVMLQQNGTFDTAGNTGTISGVIGGTGGLIKVGSGELVLNGANTFSGDTVINTGTLTLGNILALQNSTLDYNNQGGTLSFGGLSAATLGGLKGAQDLDISGVALSVGNNGANTTYSGQLTGSGTLTKIGVGTLVLSGANTYSGGTYLNAGAIQISADNNLGNTAGVLTMGGGSLQLGGNVTVARSIELSSNGTFDTQANTGTLNGAIGGTGGLIKIGSGELVLGTANTFSGNTVINDGTLTLGNALALQNSTLDYSYPGVLNFGGFNAVTLGGLQGNSNLNISGVALSVGNNNNNTAYGGVLSGNGSLIKIGTGMLILSNANTYSRGTIVGDGTLAVGNSSGLGSSSVSVTGGTLRTTSAFTGVPLTINISGSYTQAAPGRLELGIGGNVPASNDWLNITGNASLGGTLHLFRLNNYTMAMGDSMTLITASGGCTGTFATVINDFTADLPMVSADIVYNPNDVRLEFVRRLLFAQYAMTPNQLVVARTLDNAVFEPALSDLFTYLISSPDLTNSLPTMFDLIAPDELTAMFSIPFAGMDNRGYSFLSRVQELRAGSHGFHAGRLNLFASGGPGGALQPTCQSQSPLVEPCYDIFSPGNENPWGVYVEGNTELVNVRSDANASGYHLRNLGFTVGVDRRIGDGLAVGGTAGYADEHAGLINSGYVDVSAVRGSLYAAWFNQGLHLEGMFIGGMNSYKTKRSSIEGFANGSTDGMEWGGLIGGGYDWQKGIWNFGPQLTLQFKNVSIDGFTESDSLSPLQIVSQDQQSLYSRAGAHLGCRMNVGKVIVAPDLSLAWQHEYLNKSLAIDSRFANGAGSLFTVHGPETGCDSLVIGLGVLVQWSPLFGSYLNFTTQLMRDSYEAHNVNAGVFIRF